MCRRQQRPRCPFEIVDAGIDEGSERRPRFLYAQTEKAQKRLDEDCLRNRQRHVNDNNTDKIRDDVSMLS